MTTPLTPPTFGDKFSVAPTDIGSGYAAGITSAGNSLSQAIGSVMGGMNQKTGEMQPGILDQVQSSHDTLDMMHAHGMMDDDEYQKLKAAGLSTQQKMIGQYTSEFNTKLQAQLEQQKALAVAGLQESGATGRTVLSEAGAGQRSQATIEAENARLRQQLALNPANRYVLPQPPQNPGGPAPIPSVLKLNSGQ